MSTLNVTQLDYNAIRDNLKTWMKSNPTFTDYDFEASGLSFLLDTLAYNTHYNSVLANFMASEMFLDTAIKRSSVISHAKSVGYHPRGYRAARASIDLVVSGITGGVMGNDSFVIKRGTPFTTAVESTYYQFVTVQDYAAVQAGDGKYYFNDVEVVEGLFNTYEWYVDTSTYDTRYEIPNPRVDVSTIKLNVFDNYTSIVGTPFYHTSTLMNVDNTSYVFFTQETVADKIELYFGNDLVGIKPKVNNIIKAEYVTCSGILANGAKVFTPATTITHNNTSITATSVNVTTVQSAVGGGDAESIDEIKFFASSHFPVQDRAVTATDYSTIIRENFTNIESIRVWGGEDHYEPQYNTLFVCIKPNFGEYLTQDEKNVISGIIATKSVMKQNIRYVNPEYTDINITTKVYYDTTLLSSTSDLSAIVRSAIMNFSNITLEKFSNSFRFSNLLSAIDNAHSAVKSNSTSVALSKTFTPEPGKKRNYTFNFNNTLNLDLYSSTFNLLGTSGTVSLKNQGIDIFTVMYDSAGVIKYLDKVGVINPISGVVTLNSVTFLTNNPVTISITATTDDLVSEKNTILRISPNTLNIRTIAETSNRARVL